jgi:predicted nucleotidyltransferase
LASVTDASGASLSRLQNRHDASPTPNELCHQCEDHVQNMPQGSRLDTKACRGWSFGKGEQRDRFRVSVTTWDTFERPSKSAANEEYHQHVSRQEVLSTLRAQQAVLHARFGVTSLALFGSVARDEAGQDSDVDLLVEFDRPVGLFRFMELQSHLEDLLRCGVDLGTPQSLKPRIRDRVLAEAVRVV